MNKITVILFFGLFSLKAKSQDDCEKFKNEPIKKFIVKIAHVSSKTNGIKSFSSFGVESCYYLPLTKKNKFGLQMGLGYYYRTLMHNDGSGNYDGIDIGGFSITNFTMKHQTLELPICFKYNLFKSKSNNSAFSVYVGASLIYLLKGQLSFTRPELRDILSNAYVPKEDYSYNYNLGQIKYEKDFNQGIQINTFFPNYNLKLNAGLEYFFTKNTGLGFEYNYFFKPIGKTFRSFFGVEQKTIPNYKNLSLMLILKF